jgi:anti-sigma factor RsiW
MRGLATRSFNELIDPRGPRQQMFSGRPTPDLSYEHLDAHVCEIQNEDGATQILRCVNLQTFDAREQRGEVGQNVKWSLARAA